MARSTTASCSSSVKPTALDTEHAIPERVALVKYVEEHPFLPPAAVVTALAGGDAEKVQGAKAHIMWLLEKGHLVCYANGGLVVPADHPKWRPAPRKGEAKDAGPAPAAGAAPAEPAAEAAPAEPAAVPETAPAEPAAPAEAPVAE